MRIERERVQREADRSRGDASTVRHVPLFQSVDEDTLEALLEAGSSRVHARGEVLAEQGDVHDRAFVIMRGCARLLRLSPGGGAVALETLQAGEVYGHVPVEGSARLKSRLEVGAEGTVVYIVPSRGVQELVVTRLEVALKALAATVAQLERAYDRIEALVFQTGRVRLAYLLGELARARENHDVEEMQAELACMVGISREEVTRALGDFRQRGLISSVPHRRELRVPDPDRLIAEVVRLSGE